MIPFIQASLYLPHTDGSPFEKIEKVLRANDELFRHYGIRVSFDVASSISEAINAIPTIEVGAITLKDDEGEVLDPDKSYIIINGKFIPIEGDEETLAKRIADAIFSVIVETGLAAAESEEAEYLASFREPPRKFGAMEYVLEAA